MIQILSMRDDSKAEQISQAANKFGFSVNASPYNKDVLFSVFLFLQIFSFKKPHAILVRYLNDHPNLFRSLLLALNVVLTLVLCKLFRIQIFWILHNVDKETIENYPRITLFLRKIVGTCSEVIFVTDPLLIPIAVNLHPYWADKIDFITFGMRKDKQSVSTDTELLEILVDLQKHRKQGGIVLFCPTSPGDKCLHIANSTKLCDTAKKNNIHYKILMVGNLNNYLKFNPELKESLTKHDDIILLNRYVKYNSNEIAGFFDAYWRSLSDQSVSFTLYEAASIKKPLLTLNQGFMGKAIKKYEMGAVLENNMSNFKDCHSQILKWDDNSAARFLEDHSWQMTARQIKKYISDY